MRKVLRPIARDVQTAMGVVRPEQFLELAYDSVAEARASVHLGPNPDEFIPESETWDPFLERYKSTGLGPHTWFGSDATSTEHFYEMLDSGAPQLRDRMLGMMSQIELPYAMVRPEITQRRRRTRGEFGNEVDIHRVYQGRCDVAWDKIVTERVSAHGNRLVHLVVDNSAPFNQHADDGLWLGAAVMRIYEALARMGCSVAVSVYFATVMTWVREPRHGMLSMLVKDYGQPLREEQLALVSSLTFFRTIMIPLLAAGHQTASGMGYPTSDYELRVASAEEDEQRGGNVITVGKAFNRAQAERLIYDFLEQHVHGEIAEGKTSQQLYGHSGRGEEAAL